MVKIAPSILSADFAELGAAVRGIEDACDWIHVDVMDGHFVPNLTIGPPVVASLRRRTSLPLDCHLMISDPESYVDAFAAAGADSVTIHVEACPDPTRALCDLRSRGLGAGLSLNPDTPFGLIEPYLDFCDVVLVMTVQPGFGGQSFRADVVPKIAQIRAALDSRGLAADIEVDGGIAPSTARTVVEAGATVLVAGSAIFGAADPRAAAADLRRIAEAAEPAEPALA